MAPEQLFGVLVLAVILLVNLLGRLLRPAPEEDIEIRRLEPRPTREERTKRIPPGPKDASRRKQKPEGAHPVATPPVRLRSHRLALKNRRSLKDAIVLMTVLGPCRGQDPSG
jgi:hypothetical protein